LKTLIQKNGINFLREQVLTKKTINSLPAPKLKEVAQMIQEIYAPMKLDKNDLESFIKHAPTLTPVFSVVKEMNYPSDWFDALLSDIRGSRTAFDQQSLQSEKKGLVLFLYEFAKANKDVSKFKKLQNAVLGIDYLEKELTGRLPSSIKFTVHGGSNLASKDSNGLSDPYVKFTVGDEKKGKQFKTKIIWKTLDPSWDETFEWKNDGSVNVSNLHVSFFVFDKDVVGSDDYMGECAVDCSSPWVGVIMEKTAFELHNTSKPTSKISGSIFLSIEAFK